MRTIREHWTNEANRQIGIEADDQDPDNGNASHDYTMTLLGAPPEATPLAQQRIWFQHGPINEEGVNGVTNEILLVIVADRLRGFQSGKYACDENDKALNNVLKALAWLETRTRNREARNVEGTSEV